MTAAEIEAEVGLSVEAVKWAKERGGEGFAAWRAARSNPAGNYRSLCLALKRAHDSRERFFLIDSGAILGEPILVRCCDRRHDPAGALEYADLPASVVRFELSEVQELVKLPPEQQLEAWRVAFAAKKLCPGSRFAGVEERP